MIDSIKQKLEKLNPLKSSDYKKAGVFIGILNYGEYLKDPEIIFTKRSSLVSTHSGEVSFPGGKWEEGDIDLYDTALRESYEEMNLDREGVTKLGALSYLISRHKIEVHPFVGIIDSEQDLVANDEIEVIFSVPLSYLLNIDNAEFHEMERKNQKIKIPSWVYNEHRIWGLTAMITADFLNICFDADIRTDLDIIRGQYDY
jgi:8-oxo-dGTP pyrophosphatase MutT (NUDIX family)